MKPDYLASAITAAVAMALPCAIVVAQSLPPQPGQTHAELMGLPSSGHYMSLWELDTNKDRHLTREEASKSPAVSRRFNEIDSNRDGILSPDELKDWSFRAPATLTHRNAPTTPEQSNKGSARD